jgi:putative ABC transport system permease protein
MGKLGSELRYAIRQIRSAPLFTAVVVGVLAIVIGATVAIFSISKAALLIGLPYVDADNVVTMRSSYPDFVDIISSTNAFDSSAVWASNQYNIPGEENARQILGGVVQSSFFTILKTPELGRAFNQDEESLPLAVIGHDLWQTYFSGDSQVLGRTLVLSGKTFTVIGVMPRNFQYPDREFQVWVPFKFAMQDTPQQLQNRQLRIFRSVFHLRPGVNVQAAQAQVRTVSERLERQFPATNSEVHPELLTLRETTTGDSRPALVALLSIVALVWIVACANIANLLVVRTSVRSRYLAIRAAMGATSGQISRLLILESLVLSSIGAGVGTGLASFCLPIVRNMKGITFPQLSEAKIDSGVILFSIGLALLTTLFFSLVPALQAGKIPLLAALREGTTGSGSGRSTSRARSAFVVLEIAISLVVLIGAGLVTKSFHRMMSSDPGFRAEHLLMVPVPMPNIKEASGRAQVVEEVLENVSSLPGVEAVGGGSGLPPQTAQRGTRFALEADDDSVNRSGYYLIVTRGYFSALGTRLLQGRAFDRRDNGQSPEVAIINESLARSLFPSEPAVGQRLRLINPDQSPAWRTIIGVVQDVKYQGLKDDVQSEIYTPFSQTPFLWTYLMVRSNASGPSIRTIREAIFRVNRSLPIGEAKSMDQLLETSVAQPRMEMRLIALCGGLALMLTVIGICGVVSYTVAQQTREIGIRMALGAPRFTVLRNVLHDAGKLVVIGTATGTATAFFAVRLMRSMLYEVQPTDASVFLTVILLLCFTTLAASILPAFRATKIDPVTALRSD